MKQEDREHADGELVERALEGDQVAFRELVCLHGPSLLALSRSYLGDPVESEDMAQEALMAAWQGLAKLKEPERFAPWLYQITRNLCRKRLEARRRAPSLHSMDSNEAGQLLVGHLAAEPTEAAMQDSPASPALTALRSLPEEYALVLRLRHIEGLDLGQISALCDLSVSGVNTRLYRGRKMLRDKLEGMER